MVWMGAGSAAVSAIDWPAGEAGQSTGAGGATGASRPPGKKGERRDQLVGGGEALLGVPGEAAQHQRLPGRLEVGNPLARRRRRHGQPLDRGGEGGVGLERGARR